LNKGFNIIIIIIIIIESVVPIRKVVYEFFPLLSAVKILSSFQLLPASLITSLLQLFFGLPFFLFP
jgi:hypothetical protein